MSRFDIRLRSVCCPSGLLRGRKLKKFRNFGRQCIHGELQRARFGLQAKQGLDDGLEGALVGGSESGSQPWTDGLA